MSERHNRGGRSRGSGQGSRSGGRNRSNNNNNKKSTTIKKKTVDDYFYTIGSAKQAAEYTRTT